MTKRLALIDCRNNYGWRVAKQRFYYIIVPRTAKPFTTIIVNC